MGTLKKMANTNNSKSIFYVSGNFNFFFFATSTLNHTFTLETKEQKMGG